MTSIAGAHLNIATIKPPLFEALDFPIFFDLVDFNSRGLVHGKASTTKTLGFGDPKKGQGKKQLQVLLLFPTNRCERAGAFCNFFMKSLTCRF